MSTNKENSVFENAMASLLAKVDSTEKFVLDQAPEVCRQLIAERKVTESMDSVLNSVLSPLFGYVAYCAGLASYGASDHGFGGPGFGTLSLITGVLSLVSFGAAYCSIQNLLCLKVAPKAFLLREFKELATKESDDE